MTSTALLPDLPDDELVDWLRLSLGADGIGAAKGGRLLEEFGSPAAIFAQSPGVLASIVKVKASLLSSLADPRTRDECRNELSRLRAVGVRLRTLRCPDYPYLLKQIPSPPITIGALGSLWPLADERAFAIVGTRRARPEHLRLAHRLARDLAAAGVVVVSGLARGVDRSAHEGALSVPDGRTVAVLGCGLSGVYPREHRRLAGRIRERGALVSELAVDAPPRAHHFPRRNRILSGLSKGTAVIAGEHDSGALITTKHAGQQDREVFAVPGPLDDPLARGPNLLLKDGAHLLEGADDILKELRWLAPGVEARRPRLHARAAPPPLPGLAGRIEGFLRGKRTGCHFDDLVLEGVFEAHGALVALGQLEARGRVRRLEGGAYALTY